MSHVATNWAFALRGIKPELKLLLLCLADRHNPDHGCFPSQATLASDACVPKSTLNVYLKQLEAAGLIRRERRIDPVTKRQMPTRYILAFEEKPEPYPDSPSPDAGLGRDMDESGTSESGERDPGPETGHGAESRNRVEPSPEIAESRLQNLDTNPVKEPVTNPRAHAHARGGGPSSCASAQSIVAKIDPKDRLGRLHGAARGGGKRSADESSVAEASPGRDPALFFAEWVNGDRHLPSSAVSNRMRDQLLSRGLVSLDRLRERGVA